ncbi:MAG TPA: YdeI/OmpD-associated family protein [Vicinamibacterales bacterium]|nr:YdeI/OmpD-associated family protein [Vicinamibacterales bacterium]
MPTKDPRVDAYIAQAQPFARPILRHLRKVVHAGCPDVVETMKWRMPHFDYKGPFSGMAAFKAHCTFGFWKASLLEGLANNGEAMGQFGCIRSLADLPPEKTLLTLVTQAVKLNDEEVKVKRAPKAPKAPITVPAGFAAALKKHKKAQAAFDAFSPSHRREYVEWIAEAKQDATRDRRIAQAMEWMTEGKSRHWKYQGPS